MSVVKFSLYFMIITFALLSDYCILAKRGCASFGHSCYGGHGKRSSLLDVSGRANFPAIDKYLKKTQYLNQQIPHFSSHLYAASRENSDDVKSLLFKSLVRSYEENSQKRYADNDETNGNGHFYVF